MFIKHPGAAGEETPGTATTGADSSSALMSPPPAPGFPTSFLIPEAAFVLGVSESYLHWLIDRGHATSLVTEDGVEFMTQVQLDRLDDWLGRTELEFKLVKETA